MIAVRVFTSLFMGHKDVVIRLVSNVSGVAVGCVRSSKSYEYVEIVNVHKALL